MDDSYRYVIGRLETLPSGIEALESEVLAAHVAAEEARALLGDLEASVVASDSLNGKNAEARQAQLRLLTADRRAAVAAADEALAEKRVRLNRLHNDFRAAQAIAGLLKDKQ